MKPEVASYLPNWKAEAVKPSQWSQIVQDQSWRTSSAKAWSDWNDSHLKSRALLTQRNVQETAWYVSTWHVSQTCRLPHIEMWRMRKSQLSQHPAADLHSKASNTLFINQTSRLCMYKMFWPVGASISMSVCVCVCVRGYVGMLSI